MRFLIINGPNLNLLGIRKTEVYGEKSFEEYLPELRYHFSGHTLSHFQTNYEGMILDRLHNEGFTLDGIVLNPGGLAHTSIVLRDAVEAISSPVVEVHISNTLQRESFRKNSYLADVVVKQIIGKGLEGYRMALDYLVDLKT